MPCTALPFNLSRAKTRCPTQPECTRSVAVAMMLSSKCKAGVDHDLIKTEDQSKIEELPRCFQDLAYV